MRSFRLVAVAVLTVVLALSPAQNAFALVELGYDDSEAGTSQPRLEGVDTHFEAEVPSQAEASGSGRLILLWDGDEMPQGWTLVSGYGGDFYHRFPLGSPSYGDPAGSEEHYHNLGIGAVEVGWNKGDSVTPQVVTEGGTIPLPQVSEKGAGGHRHQVVGQSGLVNITSASNIPLYQDLKVIRYDGSPSVPTTIPGGAIAIFSGNPPSGWDVVYNEPGRYVRGAEYIGTGGSPNHKHVINLDLGPGTRTAPIWVWCDPYKTPLVCRFFAHPDHTHHFTEKYYYSSVKNNSPPYITVILAKAATDTSIPFGMIGMFDGTPPTGWSILSNKEGPFYNRFITPSSKYGLTGGEDPSGPQSIHSDLNIFSGFIQPEEYTQGAMECQDPPSPLPSYCYYLPKSASPTHYHKLQVPLSQVPASNGWPPNLKVIFAKSTAKPVSITFNLNGVGSDASSSVLTIDGANYTYSDLPTGKTFYWYSGSTHSVSANTVPSSTDGKQYAWTSWTSGDGLTSASGTYTTPRTDQTVIANYETQFGVTFYQSGVGGDFTGTVATINGTNYGEAQLAGGVVVWVEEGGSVSFNFSSPLMVGSEKRYVWTSTSGLSNQRSDALTVSAAGTVTANYKTQYLLTIKTNGLPSPHTTPIHMGLKAAADDYGVSVINDDSANGWRKWFDASSATGTVGVKSLVSWVSRLVFEKWSDESDLNPHLGLTLTAAVTLTANYKTRHLLAVGTHPAGLTQPKVSPSGPWYDAGTNVTCTVEFVTVPGYDFSHWNVDGAHQGAGVNPITVTMDGPHVAMAHYVPTDHVTIASTPDGGSGFVTVDGNPVTTPYSVNWDVGSTHSIAAADPANVVVDQSQYRFVSWNDTGDQSHQISVPETPTTYVASFVKQYYLTVDTDPSGLTPEPTANPSGPWYDAGTSVTCTAQPLAGYVFDYWVVDGVHEGAGVNEITFRMDEWHTVTAHYTPVALVTITSSPDTGGGFVLVDHTPVETTYSVWWPVGSIHTVEANDPANEQPGQSRYAFSYWSDGGDAFHSITVPSSDTTYTAYYVKQYYVAVTSPYGNPTSSGWADKGYDYQTGVSSPDGDYKCDGYKVDGGDVIAGTSYTFTGIEAPHTIEYLWSLREVTITITSDAAGSGFVKVDGVERTTPQDFTWTIGSQHQVEALSPVGGGAGIQYVWLAWSDHGAQIHTYATGHSDETVTANYKTQYYLALETNPPGVTTPTGAGWYDEDSTAWIYAPRYVEVVPESSRYNFTGWTGDCKICDSEMTTVTMNATKTVTANYKHQSYLSVLTYPQDLPFLPYVEPPGLWYDDGTVVLCAAFEFEGYGEFGGYEEFLYWEVDGVNIGTGKETCVSVDGRYYCFYEITVTVASGHTAVAYYYAAPVGGVLVPVSKLVIASPYLLLLGLAGALLVPLAAKRRRRT